MYLVRKVLTKLLDEWMDIFVELPDEIFLPIKRIKSPI